MGHELGARCLHCDHTFTVQHGGGFFFHLLRCERCGKTRSVGFDELGELHLHYVKGLPSPYCMASADHDRFVQEHLPLEPITEDDYHRGVEEFAGRCCCGEADYQFKTMVYILHVRIASRIRCDDR